MSSNNDANQFARKERSLAQLLMRSHLLLAGLLIAGYAVVNFVMAYQGTYGRVESELLGAAETILAEMRGGKSIDEVALPTSIFDRFGRAQRDHAYWVQWDKDRQIVSSHGRVPPDVRPARENPPTSGRHPFHTRGFGTRLEVFVTTPDGGQLMVGRPMAKEYDSFLRILGYLLLSAVLASAIAIWLAWWMAKTIAAPISALAEEASGIDNRSLDRRLETAQITSETDLLRHRFNNVLAELEQAFMRQRQFTRDAAHELRTPVSVILAQSELTLARPRSSGDYQAALKTCRDASMHMGDLVNQLLTVSKIESEPKHAVFEPIVLATIANECTSMMQIMAAERDIELVCETEPVMISGNATHLRQAVLNIISNAIQYSPSNTSVNVRVFGDADMASIVVQDQGIGISKEDIPKVCDRFYRAEKARTISGSSGTGLGLSIVSEIVKQHRGELKIESEEGKGSKITLQFPRPR